MDFKPVDFFTEEACCGIVLDGNSDQSMYYHDLGENEISTLDVDFKSYFNSPSMRKSCLDGRGTW